MWDLLYSGMLRHADIEMTVIEEEGFILTDP